MNIKLFRLSDDKLDLDTLKKDEAYINELNDALFDNDYTLDAHARTYLFGVLFVESDQYINSFKKIKDKLTNPVLILVGKGRKAFKGALEVNAKLMLEGYHPLIVKGGEKEDSSLISEVSKVMIAKNKIVGSNIAIIGNSSEKRINDKIENGDLAKKFKFNIIKIGNLELEDAVEKAKLSNLPHKIVLSKKFTHSDYVTFNKLYNALMYLVDKYKLSAIALNVDYDEHFLYPLASLLNEKGFSLILENDLHGLFSLMLLNALNDSIAIYADIVNIDLEKSDLILASSSVPFSFINNTGALDKGDITMLRFGYDNKHFLALNGKITSSSLVNNEVEIVVHLEERDVFEIFREAIGGTLAFSYGDSVANIFAYDSIIYFDNKNN